ncbi:MAG: YlxR family protein [Candidatus Methylomirabilia bacterium]
MRRAALRTCVGCRRVLPKAVLVRLVRQADGRVGVDRSGRTPGRGAYVCPGLGCVENALKRGRLARAFRAPVEGSEEFLGWAVSLRRGESGSR